MLAQALVAAAPRATCVEVFKTTIATPAHARVVLGMVRAYFPEAERVTLDLDDCDRVLRVQGPVSAVAVRRLVTALGFGCEALAD